MKGRKLKVWNEYFCLIPNPKKNIFFMDLKKKDFESSLFVLAYILIDNVLSLGNIIQKKFTLIKNRNMIFIPCTGDKASLDRCG